MDEVVKKPFDFKEFYRLTDQASISRELFVGEIQEVIESAVAQYNIEPETMKDIVVDSLTNEGIINIGILQEMLKNSIFLDAPKNQLISGPTSQINMIELETALKDALIPLAVLTQNVREKIEKLSFLYDISTIEMKNIVLAALTEHDTIDIDEMKKGTKISYEHSQKTHKPNQASKKMIFPEPKTREEKLVNYLETVSPRQLLIDFSGSVPSSADLRLIEQIMFQYRLEPGVVNVLVQYTLLKTNSKLVKPYMDKIASHWARKRIKTVQEAIYLAKSEQKQYEQWEEKKQLSVKQPVPKTNYQEVHNGKNLALFLSEASHYQLIQLTQNLGFTSDDATIAHLLNEAYHKNFKS